ncbi:MAG: hypothetical protein HGA90_02990 [Alphaproteobacteria bacterium]|nr:hypothetical protein [Alphaproteobacteria bacterium]
MSDALPLPSKTDPRWRALVKGESTKPVKVLAIKLMLTRMMTSVKTDASPANVEKNVDELYQFFVQNPRIVQDDVAGLFS